MCTDGGGKDCGGTFSRRVSDPSENRVATTAAATVIIRRKENKREKKIRDREKENLKKQIESTRSKRQRIEVESPGKRYAGEGGGRGGREGV